MIFCTLEEAAREHGELLQQYLNTAVDPHFDKFSSLHASCWTSGTFLYIPRGLVVDQPLHSLGTITGGGVDLGHTLVVLEENAEATLLSEWASPAEDDKGLFCGATELILKAQLALAVRQSAGLGQGCMALWPPEGDR